MSEPRRVLTLFDSTCLIVGIIVGVGIYQVTPDVARGATGPLLFLGLWLLGGILSLCGALCYAELAIMHPRQGGDYIYLTRAYGPVAGFLFGWAHIAIVRPGDIALVAFTFATYASALHDPSGETSWIQAPQAYALGAIGVLTSINILGVRQGAWTQNLLTLIKTLGLLFIVGIAWFGEPSTSSGSTETRPFSLALILVLFSYGGWTEMAYVAAEVKRPERNLLRALVLGAVGVTLLYLLVNLSFLRVLGFDGIQSSDAIATDAVNGVLPGIGGTVISALICLSALGALNGMIFTGARISYAVGRDHRVFRPLGQWHGRWKTPAAALILQGGIAGLLVLVLGSFLNAILYTSAVVYAFYLATTLALMVLRRREPDVRRPYRVTGYPFTPLLFAGVCGFLIYSAVVYKPVIAVAAGLLLVAGLPLYWLSRGKRISMR
jgi:amino acid transporter